MTDDQTLVEERVVSTAERIEEIANDDERILRDEIEPLEVKAMVSISGSEPHIQEIYMGLTVGGPHIEVALFAGRVEGSWGGKTHEAPIFDETAEEQLDEWAEHWEIRIHENYIA